MGPWVMMTMKTEQMEEEGPPHRRGACGPCGCRTQTFKARLGPQTGLGS